MSASLPKLLHCEVQAGLTGAALCTLYVAPEVTVGAVKKELEISTRLPASLQQLIVNEVVMHSDKQQCFPAGSTGVSVTLLRRSLQSACATASELCCTLSELKSLGSEAVAYLDKIVSFLHKPPEFMDDSDTSYRNRGYNTFRVYISACQVLEPMGSLCTPMAKEIAAGLREIVNEAKAFDALYGMASQHQAFYPGFGVVSEVLPALSSVFSSMGHESIAAVTANFSEVTHAWSDCQKGLLLLVLTEAVKPFSDAHAVHAEWLASIAKSHLELTSSALRSLTQMADGRDVNSALAVHVPVVVSLLASPLERSQRHDLDPWDVIVAASRFLCSFNFAAYADVFTAVLTAFFHYAKEKHAAHEMMRFTRLVSRRCHGAYSHFMKLRNTPAEVFSQLFKKLGYECVAAVEKLGDEVTAATDCQKAMLLLCAARPMNTFSKVDARACTSWILPYLQSASWELRVAAVHSLQRLMAGYLGPQDHAHAVAGLLRDENFSVRVSAASVLGCLGRRVVRYEKELLSLLEDPSSEVRYASLVTLGGLQAEAKRHKSKIACHLNDKDFKCRMAALRALKCMGETARPYKDKLLAWQKRWYAQSPWAGPDACQKLEPITTRAMIFPDVKLKHLFKGHAPLGYGFTGSKSIQSLRQEIYMRILSEHEKKRHCNSGEEDFVVPVEHEGKEEREEYRDRQLWHHKSWRLQRQKEKEKRQERRVLPHQQSFRSRREVRRCRSYVRAFRCMEDWVIG